ncbi:helix-turn-helix domain-containing protein [Amycolatopsis pithecellobii]|uniref:helix-turn-helix domain-containing protein n=1 Tax=Amycolatopsis pithecellobii TaxID=664692 RepID=UPI00140CC19F|nr:helix-turn-helix transcriptional regulator [Amycolatopsis pithecellobii]
MASPTLLRWFIPGELRALRERLDLTQEQVAQRLRRDRSYVAQIERGRNLPSAPDLEIMLEFFGVGQRVPEMIRLRDAADFGEDWFKEWEGAAPAWFNLMLAAERVADEVVAYQAGVVPGLAQTRAYAEALIRDLMPELSDEEVRARVELRATRQQVLDRRTPPTVHWLIEEAVLYQCRFGVEVTQEQLTRVAELAARPWITIQVVPSAAGPHPGIHGSFLILDLPDLPFAPSLAYSDGPLEGTYFSTKPEIAQYREKFHRIAALAYKPEPSRELIVNAGARLR